MRGIYTGLASWNLGVLGAFAVFAFLRVAQGVSDSHAYVLAAVFAAVFCCLVQSLLVIHFIGTMKWIQQSGPTAGIEDTKPLRTAWIKGPMFPMIIASMLIAVAVAILVGGADTGATPGWLPVVLATVNLPVCALGLVLARRSLDEIRARMDSVSTSMHRRVAAGLVQESERAELLPESGRAGGKVFLFLAINVWVLYGYARFVLRRPGEPLWPYVLGSAILAVVGFALLGNRRWRSAG